MIVLQLFIITLRVRLQYLSHHVNMVCAKHTPIYVIKLPYIFYHFTMKLRGLCGGNGGF